MCHESKTVLVPVMEVRQVSVWMKLVALSRVDFAGDEECMVDGHE